MTGHEKPGSNTLTTIIDKLANLSRQIYILLGSNAWTIPDKKTHTQIGGLRTYFSEQLHLRLGTR